MRRNRPTTLIALAVMSVAAGLAHASCADTEALVARALPSEAGIPTGNGFDTPGDGGDASLPLAEPQLLCVGTDCPAPFATCPPREGTSGAVYKCQNDLMTDNDNCGECGHACPVIPQLNIVSKCAGGKCVPLCYSSAVRDCNEIIEDGCETYIGADRNNCGACGNKCPDGVQCLNGYCGCPPGKTQCGFSCVDTKTDDANCGHCENFCSAPDGEAPPTNMKYGCGDGQCGKLKCISDAAHSWENCDGLLSNGCEIDLATLDPDNCGQCGNKCGPEETCRRFSDGHVACGCEPGDTMCEPYPNSFACIDISSNLEHCGACNHMCPFANLFGKPHQFATCTDGLCGLECEPGWGDCNGNSADGCETNLMVHAGNCGACRNACDSAAGQPCVNGSCLMVACEEGQN